MFFETCESNCFPQTPRWRPQYVGALPEVLTQLVEHVDCCDGGMTKGPRGRSIRSETFVLRCEEALAAANLFHDRLSLEFGKYGRSIAPEKLAEFDAAAQRAGITIPYARDGEQNAIRTVDLSDPAAVEVVLAFQRGGGRGPRARRRAARGPCAVRHGARRHPARRGAVHISKPSACSDASSAVSS